MTFYVLLVLSYVIKNYLNAMFINFLFAEFSTAYLHYNGL
jgi:hypothetical protein